MVKHADMDKCSTCLKYFIPFFYAHSPRSKYAVQFVDYIYKTEVLLLLQMVIRAKVASFVNLPGKADSSFLLTLQPENIILLAKGTRCRENR